MKQQHMAVIYYYVDAPTTRMTTVVGELLRQLVSASPKLPWLVDNVYERWRPNVIPNLEGFLELFTSFPEASPMSVFVVVDSLEAIHASKSEVRRFLQTLGDIKGYRILVSMKDDYFQELLHDDILDDNDHCAIKLDHHITIRSVERYVRTQLDRQPVTRADSTLREGVTRKIISMIGRYRAHSAVNSTNRVRFSFVQGDIQLNYVLEGKTPQEIEKRLQDTPNDAPELYQTCLDLIENSDDYYRNLAVKTLSWLHYSRELEPLTILQLRQALAFRGDYLEYPDYISSQTIRDCCQRLVAVRGNIVRFTDPGFDDYLNEHPPRDFLSLEALAETCLASLRYALRGDENRITSCTQSPDDPMNAPSFNEHAAEFWATYARQADTNSSSLRKKIFEFLLNPKRREELINILSNKKARDLKTQQLTPVLEELSLGQTVLHVLIHNGLDDLALLIVNSPNEVLEILGIRPNYVEDALRNLGNATSTDAEHQTPLHYAASKGPNCSDKLVFALLRHGAHVNAKNRMGSTPLHCGAYSGNQRVIEILLAEHADLNEKGCEGATALHIAAARGHQHLIEFLHSKGANVSCTDKKSLNPLHYATAYGQVEVMQFILHQRPDLLNAGPVSPLHKAAEMFQFEALKFLLENDADVMSKATIHMFNLPDITPLEIAIRRGDVYAAEDLISKGAHLTIDTNWFRTECRWAHLTGNSEMFMERVQSKCGKASEEWGKTTDEHGKRLRLHQLEHLLREHQSHPALAILLAKEWSDEAYEKIQAACRLFEEFCVVDTEAKAAQSNGESNVPLKISDVVHLKLRCNNCLMYPLRGFRHKCTICPRFDLCEDCYKQTGAHKIEHILLKVPTLKWLQENHISITEL